MKTTYFTIATTRCMGVWRDERLDGPNGESFSGFETYEDAKKFIDSYPSILKREYGDKVRDITIRQDDKFKDEYIVEYLSRNILNKSWRGVHWRIKIHGYIFQTVDHGSNLELKLH